MNAALPHPASVQPWRITDTMADFRRVLSNILFSTTYTLNKSNTKRICVGIEGNPSNGHYAEVVKLVSIGTSSYRNIVLSVEQWKSLQDNFESMGAYFKNSYDFDRKFGTNHKTEIPGYELSYSSSYGHKSIVIDEKEEEQNTQDFVEEEEKSCKKFKGKHSAGIVMQHSTTHRFTSAEAHNPCSFC